MGGKRIRGLRRKGLYYQEKNLTTEVAEYPEAKMAKSPRGGKHEKKKAHCQRFPKGQKSPGGPRKKSLRSLLLPSSSYLHPLRIQRKEGQTIEIREDAERMKYVK
jgi:hypothetical protein